MSCTVFVSESNCKCECLDLDDKTLSSLTHSIPLMCIGTNSERTTIPHQTCCGVGVQSKSDMTKTTLILLERS